MSTRLMASSSHEPNSSGDAQITPNKVSYWSLPHKGQLAILCLARMADPLAQTSIQVAAKLFAS
jgi:hypothetical protein